MRLSMRCRVSESEEGIQFDESFFRLFSFHILRLIEYENRSSFSYHIDWFSTWYQVRKTIYIFIDCIEILIDRSHCHYEDLDSIRPSKVLENLETLGVIFTLII